MILRASLEALMWFVRVERLAEINCDFSDATAVLFVFAAAQQQNQTGGGQGRRGSG